MKTKPKAKEPKCKFCWDKGFSSELIGGNYIAGDFEGERGHCTGMKEIKNYCQKCAKGRRMLKQSQKVVK